LGDVHRFYCEHKQSVFSEHFTGATGTVSAAGRRQ